MKFRSFSCGRGVHKVFLFKSLFHVESGYMVFHRHGNKYTTDIKRVNFLKGYYDFFSHKISDYFYETTGTLKQNLKP